MAGGTIKPWVSQERQAVAGYTPSAHYKSARDFQFEGGGGAGLAALAKGLGQLGGVLFEVGIKERQQQRNLMLLEDLNAYRGELGKWEDDYFQNHQGATAQDAEQAGLAFHQARLDQLNQKWGKDDYAKEFLARHAAPLAIGSLDRLRNYSRDQFKIHEGQVLAGTNAGVLARIDADPANAARYVQEGFELYRQTNPHQPPEYLAAKFDAYRGEGAKQAVSAWLARGDFGQAEAVIEAAGLDSGQTLQLRKQVEGYKNARRTNAAALLKGDLGDHLTGLATTGQGLPGFDQRAAALLKPEEFNQVQKQENVALAEFQALRSPGNAFQPRAERYQELLDQFVRPVEDHIKSGRAAYPGLEDDLKIAEAVKKTIAEDQKAFAEKPVDAVAVSAQEIIKTQYGSDPKRVVSRKNEIEVRHGLMARQGYSGDEGLMPVLTAAEKEQMREQWEKANDGEKVALFNKWDQDYGEYQARALAEAKVGVAGYLYTMTFQGDPELGRTIMMADGRKTGDYSLEKAQKDEVAAALAKAEDGGGFLAVQKGLFNARADQTMAEQYQGLRDLMTKTAYEYVSRGRTAKAAIDQVTESLGRQYHFIADADLAQVALPKDRDAGAFTRGMMALKGQMAGLWDRDQAFFRNQGEDGVVVDLVGGQALYMTFDEVEAVGGSGLEPPANFGVARRKGLESNQARQERARAFLNRLGQRQGQTDAPGALGDWAEKTAQRLEKEAAEQPLAGSVASGANSAEAGQSDATKKNYHREYGELTAPLEDITITSKRGRRVRPLPGGSQDHLGTDIRAAVGTPIRAMAGGVVKSIGRSPKGGNEVVVSLDNGLKVRMLHLQGAAQGLKVGDKVEAGQVVALSGNTGKSTGPHLHLEISKDGKPIDPEELFSGVKYKAGA